MGTLTLTEQPYLMPTSALTLTLPTSQPSDERDILVLPNPNPSLFLQPPLLLT